MRCALRPRSPAGRGCSSAAEGEDRKQEPAAKGPPLLLIFLVPESPTSGLDKGALAESLNWAEALDDHRRAIDPERPATNRPVNILGPAFTGSQASLELTLQAWIAQRPGTPPPHFEAEHYPHLIIDRSTHSN